jgi:hypothetical protein
VLVLDGYFDESGTHAGSPAVAVAGYLSTPEQWALFASEWATVLKEWGIPYFHMADFAMGAPPYNTWPIEVREPRFARLTQIIYDHAVATVGHVIPMPEYERALSEGAKRISGGAYGLGAVCTFMEVSKLLQPQFPSARVAYVFDQGCLGAGQVLKVFQSNVKDPKDQEWFKLLSLKFENKKKFLPLQAADILAYELFQHLPRQLGISSRQPRDKHLTMLARVALRSWGYLNEEELRKWSAVLTLADTHRTLE